MKNKKETKSKEAAAEVVKEVGRISNKAELRTFITDVHERLMKDQAAPIFAMSVMQQVMSLDNIYDLLDPQNKEILQEIWVKLSQSGLHLRRPPLLFGDGEAAAAK